MSVPIGTLYLVHTPIPMPKAMKIPEAKTAADKEWNKLKDERAWLLETVKPRQQVIREAKAKEKKMYFGSLMDLCNENHSELAPHLRS